jgi:hypothetical protein
MHMQIAALWHLLQKRPQRQRIRLICLRSLESPYRSLFAGRRIRSSATRALHNPHSCCRLRPQTRGKRMRG